MIEAGGLTIGMAFDRAVTRYVDNEFMVIPRSEERSYRGDGWSCTFAAASEIVAAFCDALQCAGYGPGHRIAVLLENRPEMLLLKLAFNKLGVSWVPINPDYRPLELAYVLQDSGVILAVVAGERADLMRDAIAELDQPIPIVVWDDQTAELDPLPKPITAAVPDHSIGPDSEASLLYTSGTTGRPKGCILSHAYELLLGAWYATRGGRFTLAEGGERVYNPLPLFHINAGIVEFYGMLLTGNCMIIPERFSRRRWWREIRECGATGCHYLGVIIPVLMNEPLSERDRDHAVRWAFGAGVEPTLHGAFEERFGFPLIEGWGMTEMCRILVDSHEPRQVGTRAMGRPQAGLEVRVVDESDRDVPRGEAGEMIVRHSAATPRKGAFSGYLNQPEATEAGWRGGWWHTGDTVLQDESGMLYFVDRKKNIIRRSGENIAAAEVEAVLQAHENVAQVAVLAIQDDMRDEEVLACVVPHEASPDTTLARTLFDTCFAQLAYYKAPGWVVFVEALPVTGTQKVLKHKIFGDDIDPRQLADAYDLRTLKKRP
ncbi:MAG: AMP-binding protein [Hyphomicrobiaceae bacterium]